MDGHARKIQWLSIGNFDKSGPGSKASLCNMDGLKSCECPGPYSPFSEVHGAAITVVRNWVENLFQVLRPFNKQVTCRMSHWHVGPNTIHVAFMGELDEEMATECRKWIIEHGLGNMADFYLQPADYADKRKAHLENQERQYVGLCAALDAYETPEDSSMSMNNSSGTGCLDSSAEAATDSSSGDNIQTDLSNVESD